MDKQKLNQYKALQKEIPKIRNDIDMLYSRLEDIPVVSGKVSKSSDEFPYIEQHITVEMEEPKRAEEIRKQIKYKESRLSKAEKDKTEIEKFIASIDDSTDRQIFELTFLEGKKQHIVGKIVGLERSSVSKRIDKNLQLSHNSQK